MALNILQAGVAEAIGADDCALCGASLDSVLEEVPCLHWFFTPGPRGFRIDRLVPVFEMFALDAAIAFLQAFASADPSRGQLPVHRTWTEKGVTKVAIYWRRRRWLFEYAAGPGQGAGAVSGVELTMMFEDVVMERARIALGQRERDVVVTMLARRRPELAASPAHARP